MGNSNTDRFKDATFETFRQMAADPSLSSHQKIGFPNSYRAGFEEAIFDDILSKLPALNQRERQVLDVGPGCDALAVRLLEYCARQEHWVTLADSAEMLAHLPDGPRVEKLPGYFPRDVISAIEKLRGKIDVILCYSVIQYVFREYSLFEFIDTCLSMLAPQGALLLGDIPNASMRKRFFASDMGIAHHRAFTGTNDTPQVVFNVPVTGALDDAVLLGVLARSRAAGFDAWVLPQSPNLPMANRREDVLIRKP